MLDNHYSTNATRISNSYLGNYRLIRLLGHGGFAAVFLGEHRYLKRLAAIKVLRTPLAGQEQEHFLEEARFLANLSHPHIVCVLEFAIAPRRTVFHNIEMVENIPFLVMDYIPGGSLRAVHRAGTVLPLETVISYVKQVAEALSYAHKQRIIHRDIKPENLLLNERQEVMLSDFGLAVMAPSSNFLSRQGMAGTIPYTAPEQLRGKPGFASDQYSLGIIAYEWLCGHLPFSGGDAEIIMHHISSPPPRLRSKNPSISPAVEAVILKALEKDPAHRYETILKFVQSLELASQQPGTYALLEASPVEEAPLAPSNVFPFFYYFSQKPMVSSVGTTSTNASLYPLAEDLKIKRQYPGAMTRCELHDRLRMIQKVRTFWITEVLEPSLHNGTFITPELREQHDAVAHPQASTRQQGQKGSAAVAPGTSITEVYDQAGGELLILGEAGSGKTTLLLHLAHHLLNRAEQDESAPLPVVFHLSSWAEKQLPLDQWLIEELNSIYQVPRPLAEMWLRSDVLLPLLDGLDEVTEKARSACIIAINTYKKQHGLSPLVVCSRLTDYLLFPPRVILQRAVVVQSLSMKQVDDYFLGAGEEFMIIYQILRGDTLLYGLITTPLMLNIITSTYKDKSPAELLTMHSPKERYRRILDTYVEQMLHRHPASRSEMPQQLKGWLGSLARKMQQQGQVVFYIEQMQPKWIDKERWLQVYLWLAVLLPGALIGALMGLLTNVLLFHAGNIGSIYIDTVYGMVIGFLFSNRSTTSSSPENSALPQNQPVKPSSKGAYFKTALFVGLITFLCMSVDKGWAAGLANGIFLSALSIPIQKLLHENSHSMNIGRSNKHPLCELFSLDHFRNSIFIGVACGLTSIITLIVNHGVSGSSFFFLLTLGIRDSLRNTLLATLLSLLLTKNDGMIYCAEIVSWSWKKFWKSLRSRNILYELLVGIVIVIIFRSKQLFQGNLSNILSAGVSTGLLIAIGLLLVSASLQGIASTSLNNHDRIVPNEGIKRSLFYGSVSFLIGAVVVALSTILTTVLSFVINSGPTVLMSLSKLQGSLHTGLLISLLLAPVGGLLAALLLGWLAGWQHALLRLILRITGVLPLRLSRFLDYATDCLLLRRTGGGHIFIHRTLLEYFASLHSVQELPREQDASASGPLVRLL